jgi:hypothetical protein
MEKATITTDITPGTFVAHATKGTSNFGGIELMLDEPGDNVYFRHNHGQDMAKEEIYKSELHPDIPTGGLGFLDQNGEVECLEDYSRV